MNLTELHRRRNNKTKRAGERPRMRRRGAVYRGKPARHPSRLVELVQTDSYQLTERLTKPSDGVLTAVKYVSRNPYLATEPCCLSDAHQLPRMGCLGVPRGERGTSAHAEHCTHRVEATALPRCNDCRDQSPRVRGQSNINSVFSCTTARDVQRPVWRSGGTSD